MLLCFLCDVWCTFLETSDELGSYLPYVWYIYVRKKWVGDVLSVLDVQAFISDSYHQIKIPRSSCVRCKMGIFVHYITYEKLFFGSLSVVLYAFVLFENYSNTTNSSYSAVFNWKSEEIFAKLGAKECLSWAITRLNCDILKRKESSPLYSLSHRRQTARIHQLFPVRLLKWNLFHGGPKNRGLWRMLTTPPCYCC